MALLQNKAFGFGAFAQPAQPEQQQRENAHDAGGRSPLLVDKGLEEMVGSPASAPVLDASASLDLLGNFLGQFPFAPASPTPNLDFSPLTDFTASPEWGNVSLFGDSGAQAGVVDDLASSFPDDNFDFCFGGPSIFGDLDLFPSKLPTSTSSTDNSNTQPSLRETQSFSALDSFPTLPSVLPPSLVISPETLSPALPTLPAGPIRQHSSPLPSTAPGARSTLAAPPSSRRSSAPTGHRKGIQADQLLGLDAPIQERTYTGPSATSKRRIPAAFEGRHVGPTKKKRSSLETELSSAPSTSTPSASVTPVLSSIPMPDADEPLPETLANSIESKRRQNTLAARRSRIRKLEHVKGLETRVNVLENEKERLMAFAREAMDRFPELAGGEWSELMDGLESRAVEMTAREQEKGARGMREAFGEEDE